jgi:predicted ATPase
VEDDQLGLYEWKTSVKDAWKTGDEKNVFWEKITKHWHVFHIHDVAAIKKTNYVDDTVSLQSDAGNLAAYLYMLQEAHPHAYRRIIHIIQRVAPFVEDFVLEPIPQNQETIILRWREKGSERTMSASQLSEGTLRFMALATLLQQPTLPPLILIDEPELGLHPYAIQYLVEMLESAATQTQIIVATQSVSFINQLDPEDVIVVDRKDGQSTFKRLDADSLAHWLEDYSLGELWEKSVIGGEPQR